VILPIISYTGGQRHTRGLGLTSSKMSSLMMACSPPSMGILTARPPTAIRMFFACRFARLLLGDALVELLICLVSVYAAGQVYIAVKFAVRSTTTQKAGRRQTRRLD